MRSERSRTRRPEESYKISLILATLGKGVEMSDEIDTRKKDEEGPLVVPDELGPILKKYAERRGRTVEEEVHRAIFDYLAKFGEV
jgi:hypothetical protein